ncbi:MAG: FkbM family methyltransferase [Flavobacteriales bacterium TMED235]|nr:MAG: FkbM family methyltransferase [Flavobacteriales bacterium TMED235]|tara:strand:- start:59 stop:874 length:816 start_codon:yes stop_codon:yes gene_type:complete
MKKLVRFLKIFPRYTLAINNLGFLNTLKIIFLKTISSNKIHKINCKKFGEIYWRPKVDFGALSHLFKEEIHFNLNNKINCIFDLGANIGIESIRFRKFFPGAKIISIEPNKENYEILKKNLKNDNNLIHLNIAVWNKKTKLQLKKSSDINSESFSYYLPINLDDKKTLDLVKADSMTNILNFHSISEIDILKIDIEGAEQHVFDNSADTWIHKINSIVIEVDKDYPFMTESIFKLFERNKLSFKTYINGENLVFVKKGFDLTTSSIEFYQK